MSINEQVQTEYAAGMILLNRTGDITITWNKEDEDDIRRMVEEKLRQGYSFFTVENPSLLRRALGAKAGYRQITEASQIGGANRTLRLADNDVEPLFRSGKIALLPASTTQMSAGSLLRTASDIVSRSTVCIRPMAGG